MTRLICVLLTLFFLNSPAMGENSDFGRSSLAAAKSGDNVIHVLPNGVALPPGRKIPAGYVENPHRTGSYGEIVDGKFKERLRVDPPTPPNKKGPNYSHHHLDGGDEHYSPRPGDQDPWPGEH